MSGIVRDGKSSATSCGSKGGWAEKVVQRRGFVGDGMPPLNREKETKSENRLFHCSNKYHKNLFFGFGAGWKLTFLEGE
jgi:hypothetical protein